MAKGSNKASKPVTTSELCRDVYGFTIRPQHLQRYKQYADIYKEEEEERSARWERFLATYCESEVALNTSRKDEPCEQPASEAPRNCRDGEKLEMWGRIRQSLWPVEEALSVRFKKVNKNNIIDGKPTVVSNRSDERNASEDGSDDEFFDTDRNDLVTSEKVQSPDEFPDITYGDENVETSCPWKEELDALVQGGVPMALRGEVWQVFVGTKKRRISGHYQALLTLLADGGGDSDGIGGLYKGASDNYTMSEAGIFEKWTNQIEKDLPRTFPGHPALDEDGRNALRRLLTAYARHNPDVGYCQAMNFFAALLLLMMPEENAFWTLTGFIDDYFEGYYSEKMLESQVDQLVLDELVRRHFPRLVSHLDTLGVQVAWVTGPWFLSIFVNILPWESVLRVWDVILYEGNRSMLFRTALALLEQHGSSIMATKDAGDAVTMLQSLAGSTFDSSQLVLMACMGYQSISESQLQELRAKYRPQVLAALSERSVWSKTKRSVSSKVHPNHGETRGTSMLLDDESSKVASQMLPIPDAPLECEELDEEESCIMDLMEQVKWLKMELSRAVVESRAANLRADELENAFMELVKEDNRRLLSAKVEALENEVNELKEALAGKEKQEQSMIKVMLQMEQDQRLADDARRHAEEDAAAQRHAASILQVKYEEAIKSLADMEKRTVMAETMLEATLQYQALDGSSTAGVSRQCIDAAERQEEAGRWSWPRLPAKSQPKANVTGSTSGTVATVPDTTEINDDQLSNKNGETQATGGPQKASWRFTLGRREGKG